MRSFSGAAVKTCEKNGGQTDPGGRPGGGGQCGSPPAQLESGIGENSAHSHRARLMFPSSLDQLPQKKKKKSSSVYQTATAESLQSCPTLCDPMDGSPPGSSAPGILQQEHWSGVPLPSPLFT